MNSSIENIVQRNIDVSKNLVIALSGGVDSSVLAHILCKITKNIRLVFVQHNQVHSKDLETSAKKVAKSLNLDLEIIQTSLKSNSSETEMRDERYKHLLSNLKKDEVLLTGHNLSDKAETLLINLFRGTRLEGLKSINSDNSLSSKPMINISKKEIYEYANQNNVPYLDDPTNRDNNIVRNWIRNFLIPEIDNKFPGSFETKANQLSNEVAFRSNYENDNLKYLKKSEGYVEIPALLINKKSMERQYYLNQVAKYIGMTSLEKKDIQKVEKVIDENIKLDFFKDWICFKSAGSVLFLDKKKWMLNDKSSFESYGFFNFKIISSIDIFNKWSISIPKGSNVSIKTTEDGEKIKTGNNSIKVTEIFRNYGVNSELRNFWPLIYVDDSLYWVVGLRKSDEAIKNEKRYKSNILVASIEKNSFKV
ncbi:tRNA lysidine(34) synthetase TilS [Acidimicrobiaceae bacterium]|nr:tRNA lysidine(34) synthetase TilS [Acidimicrobiaceae bacterium]